VFGGLVALTNSSVVSQVRLNPQLVRFDPLIIPPAGTFDATTPNNWPAMAKLVSGINNERANTNRHAAKVFERLGDILSVPALSFGDPIFVPNDPAATPPRAGIYYWTNVSPFINFGVTALAGRSDSVPQPDSDQLKYTLNDAATEWLPQQVMSLLRLGDPRFVIYSYGQALRPADGSVFTSSGPFFGMVTNYQIAAEVAMRAVVRVDGSPDPTKTNTFLLPAKRYPPRILVESFNLLPPD
jgi:hypothetical protein